MQTQTVYLVDLRPLQPVQTNRELYLLLPYNSCYPQATSVRSLGVDKQVGRLQLKCDGTR